MYIVNTVHNAKPHQSAKTEFGTSRASHAQTKQSPLKRIPDRGDAERKEKIEMKDIRARTDDNGVASGFPGQQRSGGSPLAVVLVFLSPKSTKSTQALKKKRKNEQEKSASKKQGFCLVSSVVRYISDGFVY